MKILYITRKYPPSVGGMQRQSFELAKALSGKAEVEVIAWGHSQAFLPFFIFYALLKSAYLIPAKKIEIVHVGDALLSPLGHLLKSIFGIRAVATAHGLDVTFPNRAYQAVVIPSMRKLDFAICVSNSTMEECIKRGVSAERATVIPNGISANADIFHEKAGELLLQKHPEIGNSEMLLTVGRLVKRKGVEWFAREVMPMLDRKIIYAVVGEGGERGKIENSIKEKKLEGRVLLMGKVSEEELSWLYSRAKIFVMPNISVEGDMEGFGIVALEASMHSLPVVASGMEGIKDAVANGKNGWLVKPMDRKEFYEKITWLLENEAERAKLGKSALKYAGEFSWKRIAGKHIKVYVDILEGRQK